MSAVAEGWRAVRARMEAACQRAGRRPDDLTLVAVSKLKPAAAIAEAFDAGARDFGENYAQELRDKAEELRQLEGLRWHAIGSLQTNKAKYVARAAFAFHALDRLDLAQELSHRRTGPALRCFVEVNLGQEASKSGLAPGAVAGFVAEARALPNLELVGLMALPPPGESAEASRPYFQQLRALGQSLGLAGLSMGTTSDFEVAIEEGATHVRVGTAIFGSRA